MVTFAGVTSFLQANDVPEATREQIVGFFRDLRQGKLYVVGSPDSDTRQFFKTSEMGVELLFLFTLLRQGDNMFFRSVFYPFNGDLALEDVCTLVGEFLNYEAQEERELGEADRERLNDLPDGITGSFLLGRDHEGLLPLAIFERQTTPALGFFLLRHAMTYRFLVNPQDG